MVGSRNVYRVVGDGSVRDVLPDPPGIRAELLLGVLTFGKRRPAAGEYEGWLGGRIRLRRLLRAHYRQGADDRVAVRFVQPADEADADAMEDDMLLLEVERTNRSRIGKFLLQSAFFSFALLPQHK